MFPLLYVGTSLSYLALAAPAGVLADRWGRWRVFLLGYGALLAVYAVLMSPAAGPLAAVAAVTLLGAYYAATDGVAAAYASGLLRPERRGTGLALLTTSTGLARLLSSVMFGFVWVAAGREQAVAVFAVILGLAIAGAALALARPAEAARGGKDE
jgi:MFS family permease